MRAKSAQRRSRALAGCVALLAICTALFIVRMVFLFPSGGHGDGPEFAVVGLLTTMGVAYALYGAYTNKSWLVGILGPAEFFFLAAVGGPLVRQARDVSPTLAVVAGALVFLAYFYPWTQIDRIRRRMYGWTGLH